MGLIIPTRKRSGGRSDRRQRLAGDRLDDLLLGLLELLVVLAVA